MADALFAVMSADRTVYSNEVVYRLQDLEEVIKASEHCESPEGLAAAGPDVPNERGIGGQAVPIAFSYALLSKWPLNKENAPKTEVEIAGLDSVAQNPSKPFYGRGDSRRHRVFHRGVCRRRRFTLLRWTCHNAHEDSPRNDFKAGDVMGGVVIRIRLR